MANLHFHYGVMSSSKSAALIINAYNMRRNGNAVEVIKPAYDERFGKQKIVSRIGLECDANALPNLQSYHPAPNTKVILVDEVQFFGESDIDTLVHIADQQNKIVTCVCRLNNMQKNINELVEAFALVARKHPDWVLKIYGKGPDEGS